MASKQTTEVEYKGRTIYRISARRDAYNPWKIAAVKQTFPTLTAAKQYIDATTSPIVCTSSGLLFDTRVI